MSNICYFEIPADDTARAQSFYQKLFGWQFSKMSGCPDEIDYWSIETPTPDSPGVAFGGMMKKQAPTHGLTHYVSVDSVDTYLKKAQELGATVLVPKSPVPGKGYFAICLDLDHNPVGFWQCDESAA